MVEVVLEEDEFPDKEEAFVIYKEVEVVVGKKKQEDADRDKEKWYSLRMTKVVIDSVFSCNFPDMSIRNTWNPTVKQLKIVQKVKLFASLDPSNSIMMKSLFSKPYAQEINENEVDIDVHCTLGPSEISKIV